MNENTENTDLPVGWAFTTLGELANYVNGRAFKPSEWKNTGKPIIRIQNLNDDNAKYNFSPENHEEKYLVKNEDLLFAWSASLGAHIWRGETAWLNQHIFNVHPRSCTTKQFIFYLLKKIIAELYAKTHGSGMVHVTKGKFESTQIPLPPLPEQKRIVAKIEELFSELDKGIESFKTAREQLKVYRQALLKHAFEGKLTAAWREANKDKLETADALLKRIQVERAERYKQQVKEWEQATKEWEKNGKKGSKPGKPSKPKELPPLTAEELAELPQLPDGWGWVFADGISDFITKGTTPDKTQLLVEGEIPFVKVYNLTKTGHLDFTIDPTFVDREIHEGFLARSKVYPGDVLMNIVGPPLGKVSIVPDTYKEWNINQAIARYRSSFVTNRYLTNYLLAESTVKMITSKSKATAGQFNLTLEICREILIPICSQIEQLEIVSILDDKFSEVDQLDQTITTALQQAETLRQSILKKAFSGQLVPQDPNDEPAAALLARIKAERAAHGKTGSASTKRSPRTKKATP